MKLKSPLCLFLLLLLLCCLIACAGEQTDGFSVEPPAGDETPDDTTPADGTDPADPPAGDPPTDPTKPFTLLSDGRVAYGSYPQSRVEDAALCAALTAKAGALPAPNAPAAWQALDSVTWCIDLVEGGARYRGLYFTAYRPSDVAEEPPVAAQSVQYANGYEVGTVYWFCYEALCFRVLQRDGAHALLLCESVIDVQYYAESITGTTEQGVSIPANDYLHSTMRTWLSTYFLPLAFDNDAQEIILPQSRTSGAQNAGDMVFLPGLAELCDAALGFHTAHTADTARARTATDYALARGASQQNTGAEYWLDTPHADYSFGVYRIKADGSIRDRAVTEIAGVLPAVWVDLS